MLGSFLEQSMIEDSIACFRKFLAAYMLYFYAHFLSQLNYTFGGEGMVARSLLGPAFAPSLLYAFETPLALWAIFAVLILLIVLFGLGRLSRPGLALLFLLNLSFQNANPYIVHEPQQLTSLFLVFFLLFFGRLRDGRIDPFAYKSAAAFLGVYYLVASLKKINDPLWLNGDALRYLLQWNVASADSFVNQALIQYPRLVRLLSGLTLLFEISFLAAMFTRWLFVYLLVGMVLHAFIKLTISVGTFSEVMLVWYALLWKASYQSWRGRLCKQAIAV